METEFAAEKELLPYPFGSPRDILTALFRQKLKILIVFMAIFLAVVETLLEHALIPEAFPDNHEVVVA